MANKLPETDVVVVGLGAAGGIAVLPLASAGLNVVALEAGDWLSAQDYAPDEVRYDMRGWTQVTRKVNSEIPTHRPNAVTPTTRVRRHPMMNAVGGSSIHYGAMSWRLNPWDFKVVSETTRRYGAARIPKGSTVEDWPVSYDDLEPYYDRIEYEIGVSGQAGNLNSQIDSRGNVFEAPRKRPYPMPALRSSEYGEMMATVARSLNWHPFPGPAAINSEVYQDRAPCMYHGYCTNAGCPVDAKASTAVTTIPRAVATKRLEVRTGAHVTSLEVGHDGRAAGVIYVKDGQRYFQPAKVTLLASYTYENIRLLLLSKSKAFPSGLANNSEQVGRHYFSHGQYVPLLALMPWNVGGWYGLAGQGVGIDDFADDNFDHSRCDFIGGGNIWLYNERRPIAAANTFTFGRTPSWGWAWKKFVMENADRSVFAYVQLTTLPYEDNYVDLDPVAKDSLGLPVCRITADFKDNERRIGTMMTDKADVLFKTAGAVATQRIPLGTMLPSTHAYGGTRMGNNPETSVADRWGMAHEVPNLGILGASLMGTSGSKNPTQTIQALAWRTADHILQNWKALVA